MYSNIKKIIDSASKILIIQADNPDGDSLGSALALEEILAEQGKEVYLYCSVDMPTYLHFLEGWSRVSKDIPAKFDLSIIVDCSTETLLENLNLNNQKGWIASKPSVVLDHHKEVENKISFATEIINNPEFSSTGELVYHIAQKLGWTLNTSALEAILTAILGDTQGLMNEQAKPSTYNVVGDIISAGVSRMALEDKRRQYSKMPPTIYKYKAQLIERTKLELDNQLAFVTIPHKEIKQFSPLYNPSALIQFDMLQIENAKVAVVLKHYDDGKITGSIRCNYGANIGADLAASFGGGGHELASGFKITDDQKLNDVTKKLISKTKELLEKAN